MYNTLNPYDKIDYEGIQYTYCKEFDHISRYRNLRQVIHSSDDDKFITVETPNPFLTNLEVQYYVVPNTEENRLDIIADKLLGSSNYAWVLCYFNNIEDGFSVFEGQKLVYPKDIFKLFNKGEILAPVPPTFLNLSSE